MAWQDRSNLGAAPALTDTFVINDVSDTTDDSGGTVKELQVQYLLAAVGSTDVDFRAKITESYNTIAASGAATINLNLGSVFATTLSGNITSMSITNEPSSGTAASFVLKVVNDGSSTITWDTSIDWPGGTAPTLSSGNGDVDWFSFITHDGGTTWYGNIVGQDYS